MKSYDFMRVLDISGVVIFAMGLGVGLALKTGHEETPKGVASSGQAMPGEHLKYSPKPGDTVVFYTHQFQKKHWEEARKLFLSKFDKEIHADSSHVRDSFIVESPERAEIIGVTLWRSPKDLEEWEKIKVRKQNMAELDKLRRSPTTATHYKILSEVIE